MRKNKRTSLKGVKKLEHTITRLLKPLGVRKCLLGEEFLALPSDAIINFPVVMTEEVDTDFLEYCNSIEETFAPVGVLSFLHEVGHIKTGDDFSMEEWSAYEDKVNKLTEKMRFLPYKERRPYLYKYFSIPQERAASTWAVKYANAHPENIKRLCSKMEDAFKTFYKKNNIT